MLASWANSWNFDKNVWKRISFCIRCLNQLEHWSPGSHRDKSCLGHSLDIGYACSSVFIVVGVDLQLAQYTNFHDLYMGSFLLVKGGSSGNLALRWFLEKLTGCAGLSCWCTARCAKAFWNWSCLSMRFWKALFLALICSWSCWIFSSR